MPSTMQTRYAMLTHVGRVRARNEDACGADAEVGAYVVCDGMGGAAGGEIASRETAATFLQHVRQLSLSGDGSDLRAAVQAANKTVYEIAQRQPRLRGMGTTLVSLHTDGPSNTACIVHVGDSRCYRVRHGAIERLTNDHSIVEEQVRSGAITVEQARRSHLRNVITRVVGSGPTVHPEVQEHVCQSGDLFLLCSDGLNRDLADFDLLSILQRHRSDLDHAARVLVDAANLLGGGDNITVLLVEILATGLPVKDERSDDRVSRMAALLRAQTSDPEFL